MGADFTLDRDLILPERLTVLGDAFFGSCIQAVPEGMTIHGNLSITAYRPPLRLPGSLHVGGKISVYSADDLIAPAHLKDKVEAPKAVSATQLKNLWNKWVDAATKHERQEPQAYARAVTLRRWQWDPIFLPREDDGSVTAPHP